MPFDSTNFDYTKVQPVYDRDNPPKRMGEAIRMAVADLEEAVSRGFVWEWDRVFHKDRSTDVCYVCTAGAVVQRLEDFNGRFSAQPFALDGWAGPLWALSALTNPKGLNTLSSAYSEWMTGFRKEPNFRVRITPYDENPDQFKADMLALADRLEAEGS